MSTTLRSSIKLVIPIAVLCFAAGCVTDPKQKTAKTEEADEGEYEWVKPTGSRIPVKVKKGQSASATASEKGTENLRTHQNMANDARFPTDSGR